MMFPQSLADVAADYRQQGYRVVVTPTAQERPEFVANIAIDLLAFKADEKVIVDVYQSRTELADDANSVRLASLVDAQPDWRLDLVVLENEDLRDTILSAAEEPSSELQHEQLAMAEFFLRIDRLPIALLVAWTALEAGLRAAAKAHSLPLSSLTADFLLETLCSHGVLASEAYDELTVAADLHAAVVHGLNYSAVKSETVQLVLRIAKELLPIPSYEDRLAS